MKCVEHRWFFSGINILSICGNRPKVQNNHSDAKLNFDIYNMPELMNWDSCIRNEYNIQSH